jgi:hypothetical protein
LKQRSRQINIDRHDTATMATPPSNTKGETTPKEPTTTYRGASATPTPANNAGKGSALGNPGFIKGGGTGENTASI